MIKPGGPMGILQTLLLLLVVQFALSATALAEPSDPKLSNDRCLRCHGKDGFSKEDPFGRERDLHVAAGVFADSVHGQQDCVGCHEDIIKVPHRKGIERKVGCVQCHMNEWGKAQENGQAANGDKLHKVVDHIQTYMNSMHARPRIDDQSRTNASCYNCHGSHDIKPVDREERSENYLNFPNKCGTCHSDVLELYKTSVHGKEWSEGNTAAAVCADCHSRHGVGPPHSADGRVEIAQNCGNCHQDMMESYLETYHGKITQLGYGETAKCYDCHGSHQIQRVDNPASSVYIDNRLETCQAVP